MPPLPPAVTLHQLLYRALVEMRAEGADHDNKLVYHLADLFHTAVLDMGAAAAGNQTYDAVLHSLTEAAREKGLERWLAAALANVAAKPARPQVVT